VWGWDRWFLARADAGRAIVPLSVFQSGDSIRPPDLPEVERHLEGRQIFKPTLERRRVLVDKIVHQKVAVLYTLKIHIRFCAGVSPGTGEGWLKRGWLWEE